MSGLCNFSDMKMWPHYWDHEIQERTSHDESFDILEPTSMTTSQIYKCHKLSYTIHFKDMKFKLWVFVPQRDLLQIKQNVLPQGFTAEKKNQCFL